MAAHACRHTIGLFKPVHIVAFGKAISGIVIVTKSFNVTMAVH